MVLKMTISKAWAMDFVWSSVGNFLLYAKFSLSGGIQHGVLNIRNGNDEMLNGSGQKKRVAGTIMELRQSIRKKAMVMKK